ncbi:hypothetical protein OC846_005729 [Tilletia horrida]|uniref:Uncharacterized protein n=1 Tax=Tilletia horrida TaxID=155126 RepID=A0AAN6GQ04_9BASI|nr:hypothetical protein OC846_005729 [Tilletia horrida]KAK0561275.1 hypothetical protein OC861_005898 [Tilletia horrida]
MNSNQNHRGLSLASIGQAVRGLFRSASEGRIVQASVDDRAPTTTSTSPISNGQRTDDAPTTSGPADAEEPQPPSEVPSSNVAAGAAEQSHEQDTSSTAETMAEAAPVSTEDGTASSSAQPMNDAATTPAAEPAQEPAPGNEATNQAAEQEDRPPDAADLSMFAQAIQHAAAINDELNRSRGTRPTSPAFGTAQPMHSPQPPTNSANATEQRAESNGAPPTATAATSAEASAQTDGTGGEAASASAASNSNSTENIRAGPSVVIFRLPFTASDGRQALLAFHPVPLEGIPHPLPSDQPPPPNTFPHPNGFVPLNPVFVPVQVSPFPFALLYDAGRGLGWPVMPLDHGEGEGAAPQELTSLRPHLAAGLPFQIMFRFGPGPGAPVEEEQPSKEKADKYVAGLERADAELRERMARLGLGDIGDYGASDSLMDTHGTQGCGICLEPFAAEDNPEWLVGKQRAEEETVVPPALGGPASNSVEPAPTTATASQNADDAKRKAEEEQAQAQARTLREEVRFRERRMGYRCDAPACLPIYPSGSGVSSAEEDLGPDAQLIKLAPCHHEVHLGCLQTTMRVETDLLTPHPIEEEEDDMDEDEDDDEPEAAQTHDGEEDKAAEPGFFECAERKRKRETESDGSPCSMDSQRHHLDSSSADKREAPPTETVEPKRTIGKWVTCPTCRGECWAEIPVSDTHRRRSRRRQVV